MPQRIPLEAIPNQSLTIRLEDRRYEIAFNFAGDIMAADITRDDVVVIQGIRCVAGTPILPYEYLEEESGNFIFQTENDNLPDYTRFGDTQVLLYFSNSELEALRNGT